MSLYALPVSSDPRGHSYVARPKPHAGGQRNRGVDEGRVAGGARPTTLVPEPVTVSDFGVTVAMEAAAVSMSSGGAAAATSTVVDGSTTRPASGEELADSASATTSAAAASKEAQSPSEASQTGAAQAPRPTSPAGSAVAASSDDATPPSAAAAPAGAASSGLVSGADANEQADGSAAAAAGGEVAPTQTGPISWATKLKQSKMTAPPPKPSSPTVAPQQPLAQQSEFDQVSEGWRRRWWQPPWRGWGSPNIIAWQGKGGGPLRRSDGAAATGWRRL
eukprot:GHVU01224028.1.p1 GENE.GHVU01224028.1~~GHVU01224028.1.p1  ORF type:complete len:277 (-),score=43.88 GHVU01224028.1:19-849(-)